MHAFRRCCFVMQMRCQSPRYCTINLTAPYAFQSQCGAEVNVFVYSVNKSFFQFGAS